MEGGGSSSEEDDVVATSSYAIAAKKRFAKLEKAIKKLQEYHAKSTYTTKDLSATGHWLGWIWKHRQYSDGNFATAFQAKLSEDAKEKFRAYDKYHASKLAKLAKEQVTAEKLLAHFKEMIPKTEHNIETLKKRKVFMDGLGEREKEFEEQSIAQGGALHAKPNQFADRTDDELIEY